MGGRCTGMGLLASTSELLHSGCWPEQPPIELQQAAPLGLVTHGAPSSLEAAALRGTTSCKYLTCRFAGVALWRDARIVAQPWALRPL